MSTPNGPPGAPPGADEVELTPDQAPAADLPLHARERLAVMRKTHFFTSDLSVSEFLLVKEVGFEPLGMVMGSSIYHLKPVWPPSFGGDGEELTEVTQALYHARELALGRMEEEAEALDADGVIGVRFDVNLHAFGGNVMEFVAVGTAVRARDGNHRAWRVPKTGKAFASDLSGQDFWTLIRAGYRPVGFVMGNCVWYVPAHVVNQMSGSTASGELHNYTHALYDARELAMERLQDEAEEIGANGIVGVQIHEKQHGWGRNPTEKSSFAWNGETIEFFVVGTAVVPFHQPLPIPVPKLVIEVNQ